MRWLLAGLLFALAVTMAIGTAAIRAENSIRRNVVEWLHRDIADRRVEYVRLSVERLDTASPEQLAAVHVVRRCDRLVLRHSISSFARSITAMATPQAFSSETASTPALGARRAS